MKKSLLMVAALATALVASMPAAAQASSDQSAFVKNAVSPTAFDSVLVHNKTLAAQKKYASGDGMQAHVLAKRTDVGKMLVSQVSSEDGGAHSGAFVDGRYLVGAHDTSGSPKRIHCG